MGRWKKGQSGNPSGRPSKVSPHRKLLADNAGALASKMIELATGGDVQALRWCLDRLVPPLKARTEPVTLDLAGSLAEQGNAILRAAGDGRITPDEAHTLLSALASQARIVEVTELQTRIEALERRREEVAEQFDEAAVAEAVYRKLIPEAFED
ncbi:DUF5681 domain-containing protein [Methylotetracoccus oryzae]|uniref:DUF5681 domain-containing protein n=1 Tax=Methylotetracoccus oryzae TaxID=1919059 RepID=UPI0022A7D100|nr:DUF5681 domain-containing protein [Methylotetracoccus oryzae]